MFSAGILCIIGGVFGGWIFGGPSTNPRKWDIRDVLCTIPIWIGILLIALSVIIHLWRVLP